MGTVDGSGQEIATIADMRMVEDAAKLLGVDLDKLVMALTMRIAVARNDRIRAGLPPDKAANARDRSSSSSFFRRRSVVGLVCLVVVFGWTIGRHRQSSPLIVVVCCRKSLVRRRMSLVFFSRHDFFGHHRSFSFLVFNHLITKFQIILDLVLPLRIFHDFLGKAGGAAEIFSTLPIRPLTSNSPYISV